MKKIITLISVFATLIITGCSKINVDVMASEKAYVYSTDINNSRKYNSGTSDYFYQYPFESDFRVLYVDYGLSNFKFNAKYTLPTEQKISIDVSAEIIFKLLENPQITDGNNNISYKDDKYIQYFTNIVSPIPDSRDQSIKIDQKNIWLKLMAEPTDLTFRSIFTDAKSYPSFDDIENSIPKIQREIKDALTIEAKKHNIEIVGVIINDIPVPKPIADSRETNLRLSQESINQVRELEIKSSNAAMQMAVDVRYAINDVIIDQMVSDNTNKTYMLLETLRKGVERGNSMQISLTPDFLRYLENDGNSKNEKKTFDKELFNKLNKMSDKELMDYFKK